MGFSLIYTPVLHFDDINGRPLVGGRLYTYKAGTSEPATTYRNEGGTDANTNPIVLNERGECVVYVNDAKSYKMVLKDSLDNVIWEADNVKVTSAGGGGGGVNYVNESYTSSDDNVEVSSSGMSCVFNTNLKNFVGEIHVRFQNTSDKMSLIQYVNGTSNGIISTLPIMSGVTHATMPVIVDSGVLKIQVTFGIPSTPSSVKFDLVGYGM